MRHACLSLWLNFALERKYLCSVCYYNLVPVGGQTWQFQLCVQTVTFFFHLSKLCVSLQGSTSGQLNKSTFVPGGIDREGVLLVCLSHSCCLLINTDCIVLICLNSRQHNKNFSVAQCWQLIKSFADTPPSF